MFRLLIKLYRERLGSKFVVAVATTATLVCCILLFAVAPYQAKQLEQIVVEQTGMFAESVAAIYQVPVNQENDEVHPTNTFLRTLYQTQNTVFIDITDYKGIVQKSTRPSRLGLRTPISSTLRDVVTEESNLIVGYNIPLTKNCLQCHHSSQDPVGAVHIALKQETVEMPIRDSQKWMLSILVVAFIGLIILVWIMTRKLITNKLLSLVEVMNKAQQGNFFIRASSIGFDEISSLERSFNHMLHSITELKVKELESEQTLVKTQAQLQLQDQLRHTATQLAQSHIELENHVRSQTFLTATATRLASTLDFKMLLERISDLIEKQLGIEHYALFLPTVADNKTFVCLQSSGVLSSENNWLHEFKEQLEPFLLQGASHWVHDLETSSWSTRLSKGAFALLPFLHQGNVVGGILIHRPVPNPWSDNEKEMLTAFASVCAMALVNARLYETTLELSITDSLTGLMNRRAFQRVFDAEISRSLRFTSPLSVLMIDVDHFKQYNDRMGHLLGDQALQSVAHALSTLVRKVDAVARFGGEEFCIVLPNTDADAASEVADKILRQVRQISIQGVHNQPLGCMSVSIGMATFPQDVPPHVPEDTISRALLDAADRSSYEAKHRGRNQSVRAQSLQGIKSTWSQWFKERTL